MKLTRGKHFHSSSSYIDRHAPFVPGAGLLVLVLWTAVASETAGWQVSAAGNQNCCESNALKALKSNSSFIANITPETILS